MIKIIVIAAILLFLYYVGLFLYKMLQKNSKPVSQEKAEVYHLDIAEAETGTTRRIDVKEEFQKLDEKKNF
jgi:hypothetical protein